ncbi:MAG: pilin [Candidatus Competibacteraceae bacterium]|nr:pilin [Candidatus Competibacteraceae bacterium]
MKKPSGFTLIEVLVTVAIIAILAAIGGLAYGYYVIKARVVEGLEFADAARLRVDIPLATVGGLKNTDLLDAGGKPVDMMTGLDWRNTPAAAPGASTGNAPVGYILAAMDLPGFGKKNVLALQRLANGTWLCVSAAQVGAKDALAERFLPSTCLGAAMSAPKLASATPTCPPGQEMVSLPTGASCTPQCAAGQIRNSANPTQCRPDPATIATPVAPAAPPTAATAPVTPAAPPTTLTAPVTPATPPAAPTAAGGAPPGGTAIRPGDAAKQDLQCHVYDPNAPPDLCELVTVQATCTYPNNFCVTIVENHQDGTKNVTRRCGNFADDTYMEWYHGTSDDDKCRERIDVEQHVDFKCTFTCEKANCNQSGGSLRPPEDALWREM